MNKAELIVQILDRLQEDLALCRQAADEAREAAIHEESIPETQYDTLGLEASYLAHGQSKRVEELEQELLKYRSLALRDYSEQTPVGLGALVTLESEDQQVKHLFIGPAGGGMQLPLKKYTVIIVTPLAPIGKQLIGKYYGDLVELPQGKFEITELR